MSKNKKKTRRDWDRLISDRLHRLRQDMAIPQRALADNLEVSIQQVQKYEHKINRISAGTLLAISEFFGVDMSYFYGDIKYKKSPIYKPLKKMVRRTIKILEASASNLEELIDELEKSEREAKDE